MLPDLLQFFSLFRGERLQVTGDRWDGLGLQRPSGRRKNRSRQKRLGVHTRIIRLKVNLRSSRIVVMTIGQVAEESGFAASAIRYYEQIGVLPRPVRAGGRRQYDRSILERLAVLERAKACGLSLAEMRQLFYGFREGTPPSERWRTL